MVYLTGFYTNVGNLTILATLMGLYNVHIEGGTYMINSTYRIVMRTLIGKKYGQLMLYQDDNVLTGFIDILRHQNEIQDGEIIDGHCRFSGKFITPVRSIPFIAEGTADERNISLSVKAGLLEMFISGEIDADFEKGG